MIEQLQRHRKELAELMSDISEEAYCAGWMQDLEFVLWSALDSGPTEYGRTFICSEKINRLKVLSKKIEGWIFFDDKLGEKFITLQEWKIIYEQKNT